LRGETLELGRAWQQALLESGIGRRLPLTPWRRKARLAASRCGGLGLKSGFPRAVQASPRISQTTTIPMNADTIPMIRNTESGVCSTPSIAALAIPGNAANRRPSITKTRPSATRKSVMPLAAPILAYLGVAAGPPDVAAAGWRG